MAYQFPTDIQQSIQAQIVSGEFASEDEVLREALATLESRQRGLQQLRQMVSDADGDVAAGRVGLFDAEETRGGFKTGSDPLEGVLIPTKSGSRRGSDPVLKRVLSRQFVSV
jgi:antitoxin ParD1/3/4